MRSLATEPSCVIGRRHLLVQRYLSCELLGSKGLVRAYHMAPTPLGTESNASDVRYVSIESVKVAAHVSCEQSPVASSAWITTRGDVLGRVASWLWYVQQCTPHPESVCRCGELRRVQRPHERHTRYLMRWPILHLFRVSATNWWLVSELKCIRSCQLRAFAQRAAVVRRAVVVAQPQIFSRVQNVGACRLVRSRLGLYPPLTYTKLHMAACIATISGGA